MSVIAFEDQADIEGEPCEPGTLSSTPECFT
jgi:hypothetical protein